MDLSIRFDKGYTLFIWQKNWHLIMDLLGIDELIEKIYLA
jgi:hypothetical protein